MKENNANKLIKSKMNCLEHCLCQWNYLPDYRLWYNGNHVVIIEPGKFLNDVGYLPITFFGYEHLVNSFALDSDFSEILKKYFANLQ